jgi:NAD(P)-dependent dehydrogenase (short-subunit alcohol dehydrogenase family)
MAFETTTDEVIEGVDLSGKTAVITGATTGLGQETARTLAAAGAHVVVCGRTEEKCDAAMATIRESVPGASLESQTFDLGDLATVRTGADALLARHDRTDLLINNAGVMFTPEGQTVDGFETQFGTNHLGHFVLTNRLLPAVKAAAPSRIVNLSSAGHFTSDVIWDDPNFATTEYDKFNAYGQSKTSNILFSVELDRRHGSDGVRANAVHPGMIMTELARHMGPDDLTELGERAAKRSGPGLPEFKSLEQGAATSVWVAVADEMTDVGGTYCEDASVSTPAPYALDGDAAARLWAMSEELVGESFS